MRCERANSHGRDGSRTSSISVARQTPSADMISKAVTARVAKGEEPGPFRPTTGRTRPHKAWHRVVVERALPQTVQRETPSGCRHCHLGLTLLPQASRPHGSACVRGPPLTTLGADVFSIGRWTSLRRMEDTPVGRTTARAFLGLPRYCPDD